MITDEDLPRLPVDHGQQPERLAQRQVSHHS
jgi:hypothetical protein